MKRVWQFEHSHITATHCILLIILTLENSRDNKWGRVMGTRNLKNHRAQFERLGRLVRALVHCKKVSSDITKTVLTIPPRCGSCN